MKQIGEKICFPIKGYFCGIGGSGMNGIAEVLINMGHRITGSDMKASSVTERLQSLGIQIYIGHDGSYVL